jgi:hypothetical protein
MSRNNRWTSVLILLIMVSLLLVGCGQAHYESGASTKPAQVVPIPGTSLNKVIMTADAANRLGIKTDVVKTETVNRVSQEVVPYSAMIYDTAGVPWIYTNPAPLVYVRAAITVTDTTGDRVMFSEGPPEGTVIVSTGAAELYGTEFGVNDEA